MAVVTRTDDSTLQVSISLPDAQAQERFEATLRAWCDQYEREPSPGEDDVSGYLMTDSRVFREMGEIRQEVTPALKEMLKFVAIGALGATALLTPWFVLLVKYF